MRVHLFQKGATSWGFQFGKLYFYVNFPHYWFLAGRSMEGTRRTSFGSFGWEREN